MVDQSMVDGGYQQSWIESKQQQQQHIPAAMYES